MLEPGIQFERTPGRDLSPSQLCPRPFKTRALVSRPNPGCFALAPVFGLALPLLTAVVINQVIPFQLSDMLTLLVVGLLILLAAQIVLTLLRSTLLLSLQTRVDTQMMLGFFEHVLSLPLRFFQQRSSGDMLARLGSNLVIRETVSNQLISSILDGSFVLTYLVILLPARPSLGSGSAL